MADKYPGLSPYNYTINNPLNYIDPNGMDWYSQTDSNGVVSYYWKDDLNADDMLGDGQVYVGINVVLNIDGYDIYLMDVGDWDFIVGEVPSMPKINGLASSGAGYAWAQSLNNNGNLQAMQAGRSKVLMRDYLAWEQARSEAAVDLVALAIGGGAVSNIFKKIARVQFRWLKNVKGFEIVFSENFRVGWHTLPKGNFPGAGKILPHFHRRLGIGIHRPWERLW